MSDWGGGYVTDIPYSFGWYRQQSPVNMAIGSIVGGAAASLPGADDKIMLLELGCGFGYGAMALAASNPNWSITAVDFNPAHIAGAREWAAQSGLTNVTFVEGDFSSWEDNPALRDLPQMDFITMHGVWSWIPPAARAGIVRLLSHKVRPGGLVHLSYNTLPGWQERIAAARIIREGGERIDGRSDIKAREGLRLLKDLVAAKALHTINGNSMAGLLEVLESAPTAYLAHEFMNRFWQPCFAMDVAADLSAAKLDWVAAGHLTDNFPELMMTEAQREIFNRYSDPLMQELIKDVCTPRSLRHDIFARGARRITASERSAALMDITLTLVKLPGDLPDSLSMPVGRADLNKEFYLPIVNALVQRPMRVGDLLKLPGLTGKRDNPAELISILISADMVEPTTRAFTDPGPEATRFNTVSTKRMIATEAPNRPVVAASRPTGTPVVTPLLALALVDFIREGITDVDGLVAALDTGMGRTEEARTSVEACVTRFIPALKAAGVF
jgi:SAM-dependent methyltransferase